jgi:hypothetical protein
VTVTALAVNRRRRGLPLRGILDISVPGVFALVSLLMVASAVQQSPGRSMVGLLLIAAGIPVYLLFRKRHAVAEPSLVQAMEAASIE